MPDLSEHHIEDIIKRLRKGQDLPLDYKHLLFPPLEQQYSLPDTDEAVPEEPIILIVDDNEFNRDLLTDQLEFHGYNSETAVNGADAIEKMKERDYDLILLDIMMPVMDGYEVLEHMKDDADLRHLPVIVISAVDDKTSVVRCIEMGAEDYLFKPFDSTLLLARIVASLEKKHLRDQEQKYLTALEIEQEKSEQLLLNILPRPIAKQLKESNQTIAESFAEVTVLFADIVDFTSFASIVPPITLVDLLNDIFSAFDMLAERYDLEKIKTVGDAYMVVGGLPTPRDDHAEAVASMALDMQKTIGQFTKDDNKPFEMRIGINTGPVVAGVIGAKKFIYDLWGDTVNIASRMEAMGLPGQIQVTENTYDRLRDAYLFEERGSIEVKGKGEMNTYLLKGQADGG